MRKCSLHLLLRQFSVFAGIVCFALIIRIGFVIFLSSALDSRRTLSVDALSYHQVAQNLVEHHIFTSPIDPPYNPQLPSTFRPPLTPFYLAAIYRVFGVNLLWGRLGLALISAISCGLTYWLGEKLFGRTTGIVAGVISCGYPFFLLLVHLPLTEGLSIFFSLAIMILLYSHNVYVQNIRWVITVGFMFGLLLLNKASNITMLPCIVLTFFLFGVRRNFLLKVCLVIIVTILTILPWTIRNYHIVGMLAPVNSNGGWTFYLGNNPYTAQNLFALEQGISNGWVPPKEVFEPFSDLTFTNIKMYEKRAISLGLAFIRENPENFLNFALRKLKIFWNPFHHHGKRGFKVFRY